MKTSRYQIEWMALGVALVVLGAFIGYWLYMERGQVEARERDRLQTQARVIETNLGHRLKVVNSALAWLMVDFSPAGGKKSNPAASRQLKALRDAVPGLRTIAISDAAGTVLSSNRHELVGMNSGALAFFKAAREHPNPATLYVSAPFKTRLGVYSIIVARAVIDATGQFAGVVSATLDPEYFKVLLQSVLYAPDMWTSLAHEDGRIFLFMPPDEQALGADLNRPGSFRNRFRESGKTSFVMTGTSARTGEERMMALRIVRSEGIEMDKTLGIAVSRKLSAIYAPWRNDALVNGAMFGVIAMLSMLGLHMSQRWRRKLDRAEAEQEKERRASAEREQVALRASEEKYRRIYDNLQDLYVETTLDGTILEISPLVEVMSCGQYRREELLGRSAINFYGDSERRSSFLRTLMLLGSVKDFESTFLNRDGSLVPCSISATIQPGADGKPDRVFSMVRDIAARKRVEVALRDSEERLRAIFEGAVDGILVVDVRSGKFVTGNPAVCRMLGYTLQEIAGLGVTDIHPKQELVHVVDEFERLQRGESQVVGDFPVIRKDGSVFHADVHLAHIRLGGTDCALAIVRDITERKRVEEALNRSARELRNAYRRLAQAQEAERRALTKELHDQVGQDLSALNLNLHYIDRELSGAERARLQGRLTDSLALLDETTARVRSVMGNLRPPMLDEFGLFATLRWLAHETMHRSGVECELVGTAPAQRLSGEIESTLVRIAQEALMNAVKHSNARRITMAIAVIEQQVRLEIADNGVGFEFGRQGRPDADSTWGLMTMRERAAALGGQVQVISAPGEGTRIVAEIPREPA